MPTPKLTEEQLRVAVDAVNDANGNVLRAAGALGWSRGKLEGRLRAAELEGLKPFGARSALEIAGNAARERLGIPHSEPTVPAMKRMDRGTRKHLVIPDTQVKKGVPLDHLDALGNYIVEKRPDVIVMIGDFADMPSLSSYDKGKKCFEGRRYVDDIDSCHEAMERLLAPLGKVSGYSPRLVLTLGNHEDRITRAVETSPELEGKLLMSDLGYEAAGWEVVPYLVPIEIDGVWYCHYFTSGVLGRPVNSAATLLRTRQDSATMGHVQTTDMAIHPKTQKIGLFCGTFYQHDEHYLGPQGNVCRRQIVMKHEVKDGIYDPMFVSLDFLLRRYA